MARPYTSRGADDYAQLARVLADFAAWLTPPWASQSDQDTYQEMAVRFLHEHRSTRLSTPSAVAWERCDLCGLQFSPPPMDPHESITGENYLWCTNCLSQQLHVYRLLGPTTYRAAWQGEREAAAHEE